MRILVSSGSVLVMVSTLVACEIRDERGRPAVEYTSVTARSAPDPFGHGVSVTIELKVTGRMGFMAPHVKVDAECGNQTDTEDAFFMELSKAQVGDSKVATSKLFQTGQLREPPARCQLTLSLTEGATAPAYFCYLNGATTPGKCK